MKINILILHGPNLNLIGNISSQIGQKITLSKINTNIRRHIRNKEFQLKIIQTHKEFQAINFIQRNRNWADFLLFTPMAWAHYEYTILDTIKISNIKTIQILFSKEFSDLTKLNSIFTKLCNTTLMGSPDVVYLEGLDYIQKNI